MLGFLKGRNSKEEEEEGKVEASVKLEQEKCIKIKDSIINRKNNNSNSNNNNNDDFQNEYPVTSERSVETESERLSGESESSTTSSMNDRDYNVNGYSQSEFDDEDQEDDEDYNSASSRSTSPVVVSLIDPKIQSAKSLIEEYSKCRIIVELVDSLRGKFLEKLDNEEAESYSELDIEELSKPISIKNTEASLSFLWIARYLDPEQMKKLIDSDNSEIIMSSIKSQEETDKVINSLRELLKFRQRFRLTDASPEEFAREFYLLNGIFIFGHDKHNYPVLYISAHVHRKWNQKVDHLLRRYVAWHLDIVTRSGPSLLETTYQDQDVECSISNPRSNQFGSFVMCFDCNQITYSSIDMDFLKFLVILMLNYYPKFCRYCLISDLPWICRSIWALVKTWLPEDARKNVHMITAKQLTDFIDVELIPNSMKTRDYESKDINKIGRFKFPRAWSRMKDIEEFVEESEFSRDEFKKFKAHVKKIKDNYENIGAF